MYAVSIIIVMRKRVKTRFLRVENEKNVGAESSIGFLGPM